MLRRKYNILEGCIQIPFLHAFFTRTLVQSQHYMQVINTKLEYITLGFSFNMRFEPILTNSVSMPNIFIKRVIIHNEVAVMIPRFHINKSVHALRVKC